MVKGTPQVVKGVPEDCGPAPDVSLDFHAHAEQVLASVGVAFTSGGQWISVSPAVGLTVERVDVVVGPGELGFPTRHPLLDSHDWRLPGERDA